MKATYFHAAGALALTFTIAACVPKSEPPRPQPTPVSTPAPTPTPPPVVQQPQYENFLDAPQTPGDWSYVDEPAESLGLFGLGNPAQTFMIRCDKRNRTIGLARQSQATSGRAMTIRTETISRQILANAVAGRNLVAATLPANDPLLDAMAITKGRFAVEVQGEPALYIPAWVEVSRVIEDCR